MPIKKKFNRWWESDSLQIKREGRNEGTIEGTKEGRKKRNNEPERKGNENEEIFL